MPMFCVVRDYFSSKLNDKQYKQNRTEKLNLTPVA